MSKYPDVESDQVVFPQMQGYRMACCDCGLVHEIDFDVVRVVRTNEDGTIHTHPTKPGRYRVTMSVRRHDEDTEALRKSENRRAAPVVTEEMVQRAITAFARFKGSTFADEVYVQRMRAALTAALGDGNTAPPPADQR